MPEDSPEPAPPSEFGGLNPVELFAHALNTPRPSGGARGWTPPTLDELQRALPQYEITELLGRGGMGAVYKGVQRSLDRFVAIKIFPPGIEDDDVHCAERFKIEAKAMAHLSHPGIVAVFDAGETTDGLLYFVMEFIEGTDVPATFATSFAPADAKFPTTSWTLIARRAQNVAPTKSKAGGSGNMAACGAGPKIGRQGKCDSTRTSFRIHETMPFRSIQK